MRLLLNAYQAARCRFITFVCHLPPNGQTLSSRTPNSEPTWSFRIEITMYGFHKTGAFAGSVKLRKRSMILKLFHSLIFSEIFAKSHLDRGNSFRTYRTSLVERMVPIVITSSLKSCFIPFQSLHMKIPNDRSRMHWATWSMTWSPHIQSKRRLNNGLSERGFIFKWAMAVAVGVQVRFNNSNIYCQRYDCFSWAFAFI